MAVMSTGSIADRIKARIANLPQATGSDVGSGATIQNFVEEIANDLNEYAHVTIDTTNVPTRFQNILINLGCAYTLANMTGVGAAFDMSLGEFSVSKNSATTPYGNQIGFYTQQANSALKRLTGLNVVSSTTS